MKDTTDVAFAMSKVYSLHPGVTSRRLPEGFKFPAEIPAATAEAENGTNGGVSVLVKRKLKKIAEEKLQKRRTSKENDSKYQSVLQNSCKRLCY